MPAMLQVILQHDVDNVGKSGELVRVRPGFARNYLLPRSLAVPATAAARKRIEHEKAVALAKSEKAKKEAREPALRLGGVEVLLAHKVGDDGRLFGSVTTKEIEAALKAKGFSIDKKKLVLGEPIKQVGTFEIPLKLTSDVTATLKVQVIKKV